MTTYFTSHFGVGQSAVRIVEKDDHVDRQVTITAGDGVFVGYTSAVSVNSGFPVKSADHTFILPADEELWAISSFAGDWLMIFVGGSPN